MTEYVNADPDEVLDYAWDFGPRLDVGETISNPQIPDVTGLTITPAGKDGPTVVGTKVVAWITGGDLYATYDVVCRVDTSGGRTLDLTLPLFITER